MAKTCHFHIPADENVHGILTAFFYPGLGPGSSDDVANGLGGDDLAQATNAWGSYTVSVDDGAGGELSGIHRVVITDDGGNFVGINYIDMDEAAPIAVSALTSPMLLRAIAQSMIDFQDFADDGYDPATNKVNGVKVVDTTTTNSDMRGTDGANTTVPDAAGTAAALHATTDAAVDAISTTIGAAGAGLTEAGGDGDHLSAIPDMATETNQAAIAGYIDTEVGTIVTNLATAQAAIEALPTLAEILAGGDIDGFTLEETLKLCLAALAGKLSGADTTTITIRAADDSKDRITATVTSDGNRTAVTLDAAG